MKVRIAVLGALALALLLASAAFAQKAPLYPRGIGCYLMASGADLQKQSEAEFIRGDYNDDGSLMMNDALTMLLWLFHQPGGTAPTCEDAADYNDDGSLMMNDALTELLYLFHQPGGTPPPPPGESCGPDPTADGLGCITYTHCP